MIKTVNSWWRKISFWNKIRLMIGALGVGGEITLYLGNAYVGWNIVAGLATFIGLGLTLFVTDANNDGIVDGLEEEK